MDRSIPINGLTTDTHLQNQMGQLSAFKILDEQTCVQSFIERASFVKRRLPDGDL